VSEVLEGVGWSGRRNVVFRVADERNPLGALSVCHWHTGKTIEAQLGHLGQVVTDDRRMPTMSSSSTRRRIRRATNVLPAAFFGAILDHSATTDSGRRSGRNGAQ